MIYNEELKQQSEKIINLIATAELTFDEGDELRSHMAKYICILCSGFLENAIHAIYTDYVKKETTSITVISFATIILNKIQNPNSEKIRAIAKNFKLEWETGLNLFLQQEERNTALNYIIKDRHRIAHGKDSDITLSRIREYHNKAVEIIEFLETQCELIPLPEEESI